MSFHATFRRQGNHGIGHRVQRYPFALLIVTLLHLPFQASSTSMADCTDLFARFYLSAFYKPDESWAKIMQGSVEAALSHLKSRPQVRLQQLLEVMIDNARPKLAERARAQTNESERTKVEHHAVEFGVLRTGSQRVTSLGEHGPLSAFRDLGKENLQAFGQETVEDGIWGIFSPKRGTPFKKVRFSLQQTYETPHGPIKLCEVDSSWIPTHDDAWVREPFHTINITSPQVEVVPEMMAAADRVFEKMRTLKAQLESGAAARDEVTLNKVTEGASEIYWILSQTWPYQRGSGGVADLATKVIFDWFDIYTPVWKPDTNPNIRW